MQSGNGPEGQKVQPRAPGEVVSAAAVVNARRAVKAKHVVTIQRPAAEVYSIAREWVRKIPDYEIVNEKENELVAWKTVGGSKLRHAGSVNVHQLADGGTEVRIEIDYEPSDVSFGSLFDDLTRNLISKSS
jgi:uncharacterized membrane protein